MVSNIINCEQTSNGCQSTIMENILIVAIVQCLTLSANAEHHAWLKGRFFIYSPIFLPFLSLPSILLYLKFVLQCLELPSYDFTKKWFLIMNSKVEGGDNTLIVTGSCLNYSVSEIQGSKPGGWVLTFLFYNTF